MILQSQYRSLAQLLRSTASPGTHPRPLSIHPIFPFILLPYFPFISLLIFYFMKWFADSPRDLTEDNTVIMRKGTDHTDTSVFTVVTVTFSAEE
jgi:hypothetical protein